MGTDSARWAGLAVSCRAQFAEIIGHVTAAGERCGYAIGVHGSLARDIDLVAVPWVEPAVSAEELAEEIRSAAGGFFTPRENDLPSSFKPHGRRVFTIHLPGGVYIDLSVMPRTP